MTWTPPDPIEWALTLVFGSPSFVLALYLFYAALGPWKDLIKGSLRLVDVGTILLNRSRDSYALTSVTVRSSVRLVRAWVIFYGIASFVTQLWAGSSASPGQGGGIRELIHWSAVFGLLALVGSVLLMPKVGDVEAPEKAMFVGYAIGLAWAVIGFSVMGGPKEGDWWVCPALSCAAVWVKSFKQRRQYMMSPR